MRKPRYPHRYNLTMEEARANDAWFAQQCAEYRRWRRAVRKAQRGAAQKREAKAEAKQRAEDLAILAKAGLTILGLIPGGAQAF